MKNLVIAVIVIGGLAYGGAKFYLHHKVSESMDAVVIQLAPYADITYEGVSSSMSGELTVDGINARISGFNDVLRIDKMGIDTAHFLALLELGNIVNKGRSSDRDLPEQFGFIVDGMHMPADADYYKRLHDFGVEAFGATDGKEPAAQCVGKYGFSPKALADLGYTEQNTSVAMYMRQDGANMGMDMAIGIEEMWDVDIELELVGDMKSQVSTGRSLRPTLSRMSVTVTDRSINQRTRDYCRQLGLSEEETLQAHMDALGFFGENHGIVFDDLILDPYKEFLGGKSTFLVTAQPNNPVNLSQISLYKPSDVPALLNLEAVAR
jgi:hypothetical protein